MSCNHPSVRLVLACTGHPFLLEAGRLPGNCPVFIRSTIPRLLASQLLRSIQFSFLSTLKLRIVTLAHEAMAAQLLTYLGESASVWGYAWFGLVLAAVSTLLLVRDVISSPIIGSRQ